MSLLDRVRRLEAGLAGPVNFVVTFALGETPEMAIARASAAGLGGGVLVVGEVLSPTVWTALAVDQQQRLLSSVQASVEGP